MPTDPWNPIPKPKPRRPPIPPKKGTGKPGITGLPVSDREHVGLNNRDSLDQATSFGNALSSAMLKNNSFGKALANATLAQLYKTSKGNSGGSGGSSGNGVAATPDPGINPFGPAYDAIIAAVQRNGGQNQAELDALKASVGKNYDSATQQLYDQYQGSRSGLDSQAKALGVGTDVYKDYDATLRSIQEQSDQSKAQDQSWFDKMKALRQQDLTNLMNGLGTEQQLQMANWQIAQAQRQIALQSGGGSRGGSGGSGSSSGPVTTTATDTETVNDPQSAAILQSLMQTNPAAAEAYRTAAIMSGDNDIAKTLIGQYNDYKAAVPARTGNKLRGGLFANLGKNTNAISSRKKNLASLFQALNASLGNGGALSIPKGTQKLTSTGKSKIK